MQPFLNLIPFSTPQQLIANIFHFRPEQIDVATIFDAGFLAQGISGEYKVTSGYIGLGHRFLQAFQQFRCEGYLLFYFENAAGEVCNEFVGGHQMGIYV